MFCETSLIFPAFSWVVAFCSSTAAAIVLTIVSISPIIAVIDFISSAVLSEDCCTPLSLLAISSVAFAVCLASSLISLATTANPLPASPARAASIVAFNANKFV